LWDGFGVEVNGVDLATAAPEVQDAVIDVFHRHGAMVIRDQTLTPEQQLAFTRRFGEPESNPSTQFTVPGMQEVYIISNKVVDGKVVGNWEAGQGWHTDASYRERPTMCTMLYAMEVPPEGSDTLLADLCAAYEALPADEKTRLDGLQIHHSFRALREKQGRTVGYGEENIDDVMHPMIRTHPADGRKALWVSSGTVRGVVGMPNPEGLELVDEMVAFATQPQFVHAHKWRVGDLLIWDNRCTLHRGTPFDRENHVRHVHRTWVKGDRPV
jgi:taurine dioxygenase